jgi:hypothetical protein
MITKHDSRYPHVPRSVFGAKREPLTPVVFRIFPDGALLALFPAMRADMAGCFCSCYAHIGQHSAADYTGCIQRSRPATPREYRALAVELRSIGYHLRILRRKPRGMVPE